MKHDAFIQAGSISMKNGALAGAVFFSCGPLPLIPFMIESREALNKSSLSALLVKSG
jgi:hypothetical protein